MRKTIIAGNWKMNKTLEEAKDFFLSMKEWDAEFSHETLVVIFPPTLYIESALVILKESSIIVGSQNCYYEDFGAFTGEISPQMLSAMDCNVSILGHSERRHIFGESDELINRKVKALLDNKQQVYLCLGETEEQRENEETKSVLRNQLNIGLAKVSKEEMKRVVLAYEPVWAIGTGKTATPEIAETSHQFIRNWLQSNFDKKIAENTPILYGGSVKAHNIAELIQEDDIDGALIGGASLQVSSFTQITKITEKICYQ